VRGAFKLSPGGERMRQRVDAGLIASRVRRVPGFIRPAHSSLIPAHTKALGDKDLLALLKRIDLFVLNDSEARQLVKEDNVITALPKLHALGPRYVIIKLGSHGSILSGPDGLFLCPAYPLKKVVDPTGAGDSFVGGVMGWLAAGKGSVDTRLRQAMVHGSVVASFCCEGFGVSRTTAIQRADIARRVRELKELTGF
jgi:sugar/nucleoside kinase (ribokinase family)